MMLLNPIYLWGLLALAVPVAIHLWSKKKVRTIKVGSIQFISETKSKQSRSIKLNEWWLLFLRCLVIALLVFILTEPCLTTTPQKEKVTYVFEPSLLSTKDGLARFENIPEESRRILTSGFPIWETGDAIEVDKSPPNYWQLAQEMEQFPSDSIVVFTTALAKGIKGKRPTTSANIHWVRVDFNEPLSQIIQAIKKDDSIKLLEASSDAGYLAFAKAKKSYSFLNNETNLTQDSVKVESEDRERWIPIENLEPIRLTIVYDDSLADQLVYLEAAFRAISKYVDRALEINKVKSAVVGEIPEKNYVVWLSSFEPKSTRQRALIFQIDDFANSLIELGSTLNQFYLTSRLNTENTIDGRLAEKLLEWLELSKDADGRAASYDKRTLDISQLATKKITLQGDTRKVVTADITNWLWIILGVLLIAERAFARYRKQ